MHVRLTGVSCALFLIVSGCSATNPFSGDEFQETRARPWLPYTMNVRDVSMPLELTDTRDLEDEGFVPPLIADETLAYQIADRVEDALRNYDTFSKVVREEANSTEADLDLEIRITTTAASQVERIEDTSTVWVNTGLWFLLGLPGWIMDDVRYVQPIEISCAVTDRRSGETLLDTPIEIGDDNVLNFLRRAGWRQYLLQLIMPPFVTDRIAPDIDRADAALYENYISLIQREIGGRLKRDLLAHLIARRQPIVLVDLGQGRSRRTAATWIFSHSPIAQARLSILGQEVEISLSTDERAEGSWFRRSLGAHAARLDDYRYHGRVDFVGLEPFNRMNGHDEVLRLEVSFEDGDTRSWSLRL